MRHIARIMLVLMMLLSVAGLAMAQDESYTVQSGDTITSIAQQFDVDVE